MDTPEHDPILEKLTLIKGELKSLRYTFGIGIIILAVCLTVLGPSIIRSLLLRSGSSSAFGGATANNPTTPLPLHEQLPVTSATSSATTTP